MLVSWYPDTSVAVYPQSLHHQVSQVFLLKFEPRELLFIPKFYPSNILYNSYETETSIFAYIKDLTRVVISYEIYETSLLRVSWISYEMSTSVRFCFLSDRLKLDFIVFKVDTISIQNNTLSRTSLWCYMYAPKCYVTCGHTIFMTWCYILKNSDVIW